MIRWIQPADKPDFFAGRSVVSRHMIGPQHNDHLTACFIHNDGRRVTLSGLFRRAEITILFPEYRTIGF